MKELDLPSAVAAVIRQALKSANISMDKKITKNIALPEGEQLLEQPRQPGSQLASLSPPPSPAMAPQTVTLDKAEQLPEASRPASVTRVTEQDQGHKTKTKQLRAKMTLMEEPQNEDITLANYISAFQDGDLSEQKLLKIFNVSEEELRNVLLPISLR